MDSVRKTLKEGWIRIGRCLALLFAISISTLPAKLLIDLTWPMEEQKASLANLISQHPFYSVFLVVFYLIYLPLSMHWASRLSNQLNSPVFPP